MDSFCLSHLSCTALAFLEKAPRRCRGRPSEGSYGASQSGCLQAVPNRISKAYSTAGEGEFPAIPRCRWCEGDETDVICRQFLQSLFAIRPGRRDAFTAEGAPLSLPQALQISDQLLEFVGTQPFRTPVPKLRSAKRTKSRRGSSTANGSATALKGALVWCAAPSNWRGVLITDWKALRGGWGGGSLSLTWSCWRATATNVVAVISVEKSLFLPRTRLGRTSWLCTTASVH